MWNFSIGAQEFSNIGFVYMWTNNINGLKYIGSHNGKKPNYRASGILINQAFKKYGLKNFTKHFLYIGPNFHAVEEQILKSIDATNSENYYNVKNEALGGSYFGTANGMFGKHHSDASKKKIGDFSRGKNRPEHSKIMSGTNNPMYGKSDHVKNAIIKAKSNTGKTYEEIYGEVFAAEIREKMRGPRGTPNRVEVICPYCALTGKGPNMTRYHFDKCKLKNE